MNHLEFLHACVFYQISNNQSSDESFPPQLESNSFGLFEKQWFDIGVK